MANAEDFLLPGVTQGEIKLTSFYSFHDDFDDLLIYFTSIGVSDVFINTSDYIRVELHGKFYTCSYHELADAEVSSIMDFMVDPGTKSKVVGGEPKDFAYEIVRGVGLDQKSYRFRVNAVSNVKGIDITIRSLPEEPPLLSKMNLSDDLKSLLIHRVGLVLVTGPTGSGKSTLLHSAFRYRGEVSEFGERLLTFEDPIEFDYRRVDMGRSFVSQHEFPTHVATANIGVRTAMRKKPSAILLGEARDSETMESLTSFSLSGHPAYSSAHTNSVYDTVQRAIYMFNENIRNTAANDVLDALHLIVTQNLIPSLDGKRVAVREYLHFDDDIKATLIRNNFSQWRDIIKNIVTEKKQLIVDDVRAKVEAGLIHEKYLKKYQNRK